MAVAVEPEPLRVVVLEQTRVPLGPVTVQVTVPVGVMPPVPVMVSVKTRLSPATTAEEMLLSVTWLCELVAPTVVESVLRCSW